jgi:hypothetical protein
MALLLDGFAYQRWHMPLWVSLPFALLVLSWWFLFLVLVPSAVRAELLQPAGQGETKE